MKSKKNNFVSRAVYFFAGICAAVLMMPRTAGAQTYVYGRADFGVTPGALTMVSADFNGDGIPDFAVDSPSAESPTNPSVTILLGRPDGSVESAINLPLNGNVEAMIAADFNGDGKLDLAVATDFGVYVFLGNGDGTFQTGTNIYPFFSDPVGLAAGDFNLDGKTDLAVSDQNQGGVSIFLGNGDGTFQGRTTYPTNPSLNYVAVGDFNGDGKPDLVVTDGFEGGGSVLLGKGDGSFGTPLNFPTDLEPESVRVADLNGDGKLDLVIPNLQFVGAISVYLGNGDGTFAAAVDYLTGSFPSSVAIGDFNQDGKPDLAVTNTDSNSVWVMRGNGDGTFRTAVIYGTGSSPSSISAIDFNGDGKLDLAILNGNKVSVHNPSVMVLLGRGDGTFHSDSQYQSGPLEFGIVTADLNGDGKLDLAVANGQTAGSVSVLLGTGDGTFPTHVEYPSGSGAIAIAVGDFNGDGKPDLATGNSASISVLLGNGDGTFQSPINQSWTFGARSIAAGDFNRDGNFDLAVADNSTNTLSILIGKGNGKFQSPVTYGTGNFAFRVITGDFNGDGKLDLAVINSSDSTVSILLGNGDGTFQPHVDYPAGSSPQSIVVGDFNGDGKLDFAVANSFPGIYVFLGNGDGTFPQTPLSYEVLNGLVDVIVAGDFNGDGKLDLALGDQINFLTILFGNGDGTFNNQADYTTPNSPIYMAAGDFNGDGGLDVAFPVAQAFSNDTIDVFLSEPALSFYPHSLSFAPQATGSVSPAKVITMTSAGAVPVSISGSSTMGDFAETSTCDSMLPGGVDANCAFSVTFDPTAVGTRGGVLSVTDNIPGSPQTVPLSGQGTGATVSVTLAPSVLNFGQEGLLSPSASRAATLSNGNSSAVNIASISIAGANAADFKQTATTCGSTLGAKAHCTITIVFTPSVTGKENATLTTTDSAANSPQSISLTGTGVEPVTLSSASLSFGETTVGTSGMTRSVTLRNNQSTKIKFGAITITGADPGDFSQVATTCGATLAAGNACSISLQFAPKQKGARVASLTILDTAANSPQIVALTGAGK